MPLPRILGLACLLAALTGATAQAQNYTPTLIHSFAHLASGTLPYAPMLRDAGGVMYGTTFSGGSGAGVVFRLRPNGAYAVLYGFTGGMDGGNPAAPLIEDASGNLYSTTVQGGSANAGVVFKLSPTGQETALYSFTGRDDGGNPYAGLVRDGHGNFFGVTAGGGNTGKGVVYRLDPGGVETVLHSFSGKDGAYPYGTLVMDAEGNLYGTTLQGGGGHCYAGCGVIFKVAPSGRETILYSFTGEADGGYLNAGVVMDAQGNLYGAAGKGGKGGFGTVYELSAAGQFTVLYSFYDDCCGGGPYSGVVRDSAGNLYGTTGEGGPDNLGVVYKIDASGVETNLYNFPGPQRENDWYNPGVTVDSLGNVYGGTPFGGTAQQGMIYQIDPTGVLTTLYSFPDSPGGFDDIVSLVTASGAIYGMAGGGASNDGLLFRVNAAGNETTLFNFPGGADGIGVNPGLAMDAAGNIYGTTDSGGANNMGVIFKVDPSGNETVLHTFTGGSDGGTPYWGVTIDGAGNLYGTTVTGAISGCGVIYKVDTSTTFTTLYTFTCGEDGGDYSIGGLVIDSAGNVYGTAAEGGANGLGTLFKLDTAGQFTVLYTFPSGQCSPFSGMVMDASGNLYGSTRGSTNVCQGAVYKYDTSGNFTTLYRFTGGTDGGVPGPVALDGEGNIYGTTQWGGPATCGQLSTGCGVIFKVDPAGNETVLFTFTGGKLGENPSPIGPVLLDKAGNLYVAAEGGNDGGGVILKVAPPTAARSSSPKP